MGESKIIVVANQKGGAGKSTICMLLANYLTQKKDVTIGAVIDTDYQQSLMKKREEDIGKLEGTSITPTYQVKSYSLSNLDNIPTFINKLREIKIPDFGFKKTHIAYLIDTPGALNDKGVRSFLALADYIVCPFDYDRLTIQSTGDFLMTWNDIKERIKKKSGYEISTRIILIPYGKPKNVGTQKEKGLWSLVNEGFTSLGYFIAPEIPESVFLRNCDTIEITPSQMEVAEKSLEYIYNILYNDAETIDNNNE